MHTDTGWHRGEGQFAAGVVRGLASGSHPGFEGFTRQAEGGDGAGGRRGQGAGQLPGSLPCTAAQVEHPQRGMLGQAGCGGAEARGLLGVASGRGAQAGRRGQGAEDGEPFVRPESGPPGQVRRQFGPEVGQRERRGGAGIAVLADLRGPQNRRQPRGVRQEGSAEAGESGEEVADGQVALVGLADGWCQLEAGGPPRRRCGLRKGAPSFQPVVVEARQLGRGRPGDGRRWLKSGHDGVPVWGTPRYAVCGVRRQVAGCPSRVSVSSVARGWRRGAVAARESAARP
ncbi:MAG: hypothetical protein BWZ02_03138 [Lentisphaerae bacterium ADurb.BinA184]|nr:MAG: hypothetical protein BWZ02_03138 [Lentisphaerae bacterium ADurb.BinA184]